MGAKLLNARAALKNILSVTLVAPEARTPSPTPGKMFTLLHCPITYFFPSYSTGGKGLPVAIIACPLVHFIRSSGIASDLDVGLERGKIMGLATCFFISTITSSVKDPG